MCAHVESLAGLAVQSDRRGRWGRATQQRLQPRSEKANAGSALTTMSHDPWPWEMEQPDPGNLRDRRMRWIPPTKLACPKKGVPLCGPVHNINNLWYFSVLVNTSREMVGKNDNQHSCGVY
jgi:hypothetical protein